jgi:hypothetical protein
MLRRDAVDAQRLGRAFRIHRMREARHVHKPGQAVAIGAAHVLAAHRGAAVQARETGAACRQRGPIGRAQTADQPLLGQELREGLVRAVAYPAFELQGRAPARTVVDRLQAVAAARATRLRLQCAVGLALGLGHIAQQRQHAGAGQAHRLDAVEPDQMTRSAAIDLDPLAIVAIQRKAPHPAAAIAAAERFRSGRSEAGRQAQFRVSATPAACAC